MIAKCHICKREREDVRYCEACDHWFCDLDRKSPFARAVAFVHEKVYGRVDGCCGPVDSSQEK